MIKYRRSSANVGEFQMPLTMMDLAWLVTIVTLCAAKFGIVSVRLPQLPTGDQSVETSAAPKGIEIAIGTDGQLRLLGQPIDIDELGPRVKAEGNSKRPIMISIDTNADGTGHTDRLVQLVDRLQRERIENPLLVRAKSRPGSNVLTAMH